MSPLETETVLIGGFLSFGALLYVAREGFKKHWFRWSFSIGLTTPEGRLLKPPKKQRQAPPEAGGEASVTAINGKAAGL